MDTLLEKSTESAANGVADAGPELENVPVEQVLAKLNVRPDQGLTSAEAQQRPSQYGAEHHRREGEAIVSRLDETRWLKATAFAAVLLAAAPAHAEMSAEELAKLAQNPVGNLISVPFQNNTNLNFGPEKGTQNILNIQPVIPIEVTDDWNVITRTILPVIWNPSLGPNDSSTTGIGDTTFTAFLSPAKPGSWIWGAGPVLQLPTNSNAELGNKNWGLGPSAVVLHLEKGDPWVYGVLANNVWSLSSSKQGGSYSTGLIQPFVNYNFEGGFYLVSAPIATVDWNADGEKWTVPLGGGVGKIFHLGKLPVNTQLSAYYNIVHPDNGANWQIRAQVQLMFPK